MPLQSSGPISLSNSLKNNYTFDRNCFTDKLSSNAQANFAAGYSIKLLKSNYSGPMINVRRGTDNTTADFYGDTLGNLTTAIGAGSGGTDLSTWLGFSIGYITTMYDQSGNGVYLTQTTAANQPFIGPLQGGDGRGAPTGYLFSSLSSAAQSSVGGMYALYRVSLTYTGATIKIRRSSDNATVNYYADQLGNLGQSVSGTGTTFTSWIGSSTAYIDTWYDQSGKGNHATQSTTSLQPTYQYTLTNPLVDFGTSSTLYLNIPTGTLTTGTINAPKTIIYKHNTITNISTTSNIVGGGVQVTNTAERFGVSSNQYLDSGYSNDFYHGSLSMPDSSGSNPATAIYPGNSIAITFENTTFYRKFFINGIQANYSTSYIGRTLTAGQQYLGRGPSSEYFNGQVYNVFIFNSTLSDNDRLLCTSYARQYNIYYNGSHYLTRTSSVPIPAGSKNYTFITKFIPAQITGNMTILSQGPTTSTGSSNLASIYTNTNYYGFAGNSNNNYFVPMIVNYERKCVMMCNHNLQQFNIKIVDNGNYWQNTTTTPTLLSLVTSIFEIGANYTNNNAFYGFINEVLVFNNTFNLNDANIYFTPILPVKNIREYPIAKKWLNVNYKDQNYIPYSPQILLATETLLDISPDQSGRPFSNWNGITAVNSPLFYNRDANSSLAGVNPGGFVSYGYSPQIALNGTSQYLNGGSKTFNINTNGGFTAICIHYSQSINSSNTAERIFDFNGGTNGVNAFIGYRNSQTTAISFGIYNSSGTNIGTATSATGIYTIGSWNIWAFRYNNLTKYYEIIKNGITVATTTGSAAFTDYTFTNTFIGASTVSGGQYAYMNLSGFAAYDRALSDSDIGSITQYLFWPTIGRLPSTIPEPNNSMRVGNVFTQNLLWDAGYSFNGGVNNYVDVIEVPDLPFSYSFWVVLGSTYTLSTLVALCDQTRSGYGIEIIWTSATAITVYAALPTTWTSNSFTVATNGLYHITVLVSSSGTVQVYVNGSSQFTLTGTANIPSRSRLIIGAAGDNTRGSNCYIKDFRVFDYLLRVDEIALMYSNQNRVPNNLISYNSPNNFLVTKNNWYTVMTITQNGSFTPVKTGIDPNVQYQLNNSGSSGTTNTILNTTRIQDYQSFKFTYEFYLSSIAGDYIEFVVGYSGSFTYFSVRIQVYGTAGFYIVDSGIFVQYLPIYNFFEGGTWQSVNITYNRSAQNTWIINYNGLDICTYSNPNVEYWRANSLASWGINTYSGGSTMNAYVRRLELEYTPFIGNNIYPEAQLGTVSLSQLGKSGFTSTQTNINLGSITGTSRSLADGFTFKIYDTNLLGVSNPIPASYFLTNQYHGIGRFTDSTNLTNITQGQFVSGGSSTYFGLEIFGYFLANITGTWTFNFIAVDDSASMWIGTNALNGYSSSNSNMYAIYSTASGATSCTVSLTKGVYYPLRIHYIQSTSGYDLQFSFTPPSASQTFNGTGYYYTPLGNNVNFPAESARVIKDLTNTNYDGQYYINVNGTSTAVYCLMNDIYDGGGWIMLMKSSTNSINFGYSSNYWTTQNTLNSSDITRNNSDAKYNTFNYTMLKDILAIYPDISSIAYNNVYGKNGGSLLLNDGWSQKLDNWNTYAPMLQQLSSSGQSAARGLYALQIINSSYLGPTIQIRRSSDNTTVDFYSNIAGNLGMTFAAGGTTFTSWIGTDTAYVTIWYDQSGNGFHATQSTTTLQPVYLSSLGLIDFSIQVNAYLNMGTSATNGGPIPTGTANAPYTFVTKHGKYGSNSYNVLFFGGNISTSAGNGLIITTSYLNYWYNNDYSFSSNINAGNTVSVTYNSTNQIGYVNGVQFSTNAHTGYTATNSIQQYIGQDARGTTTAFNGQLYYIYIFNAALSTVDRQVCENTTNLTQSTSTTNYIQNKTTALSGFQISRDAGNIATSTINPGYSKSLHSNQATGTRNVIGGGNHLTNGTFTYGGITNSALVRWGNIIANNSSYITSNLLLHIDFANTASYPGYGTTTYDLSGSSSQYYSQNNPIFTQANGGALTFVAAKSQFLNYWAQTGTAYTTQFSTALTFEIWICPTADGTIINENNGSWQQTMIELSSGVIYTRIWNNTALSLGNYTVGNWYQIVLTWSGSTSSAYLNGSLIGSQTGLTRTQNTSVLYSIGYGGGTSPIGNGGYYSGRVANIKFYGSVLTAAQVLQNFNAISQRFGLSSNTVSGIGVGYTGSQINSQISAGDIHAFNTTTALLGNLSTPGRASITASYACFRVSNTYTGPTLQIRRSSDNATVDFYADIYGNLGQSLNGTGVSLLSWLSGTAYVTVWYDQSSNGYHATQATNSIQPTYNTTSALIDFGSSNTIFLNMGAAYAVDYYNWYSTMTSSSIGTNSYTPIQSGSDPIVQVQMCTTSTTNNGNNYYQSKRVQDNATFTCQFQYYYNGGADYLQVFFGSTITNGQFNGVTNGFNIFIGIWTGYSNGSGIYLFNNSGTIVAFGTAFITPNIWTNFKVVYIKGTVNTWTVYNNDQLVFTYSDSNNSSWLSSSGSNWGIGAHSGIGATLNGYIRSVSLSYSENIVNQNLNVGGVLSQSQNIIGSLGPIPTRILNAPFTFVFKHGTGSNNNGAFFGAGGAATNTDNTVEWRTNTYDAYWYGNDYSFGTAASGDTVVVKYDGTTRTGYVTTTSNVTTTSTGAASSGATVTAVQQYIGKNAEATSGVAQHWLNGQLYNLFISNTALTDSDRLVLSSATPTNYLLDKIPSADRSAAKGIYSLYRMSLSYTGACMNLRRSSDNATSDFYADAFGNLGQSLNGTGTTFASWIGTSTAYITIWYDQSGYGNNGTQNTTSIQPVYNPTKNLIDFSIQTNSYLNIPSGTLTTGGTNLPHTLLAKHATSISTVSNYGIFGAGGSGTNRCDRFLIYGNSGYYDSGYSADAFFSASVLSDNTIVAKFDGTTSSGYVNNNLISTNTQLSTINGGQQITAGQQYIGNTYYSEYLNAQLYYVFVFNSAISDQARITLSSFINSVGGPALLDQLSYSGKSSARGIYALYLTSNTYHGPCLNIRRSIDNITADLYADINGNFNTTYGNSGQTLLNWLGNSVAYITIWYDQSGQNNHATQTTAAYQPIFDTTNILVDFQNSSTQFFNMGGATAATSPIPSGIANAPYTFVVKHGSTNNNVGALIGGGTYSTNASNVLIFGNNNSKYIINYWYSNDLSFGSNLQIVAGNTAVVKYDGTYRTGYINSSAYPYISSSGYTATAGQQYIGRSPNGEYLNGQLYNVFIFNTALSDSDRIIASSGVTPGINRSTRIELYGR